MYALLAVCCFFVGAIVGYHLNKSKETEIPLEELPIPVIGSNKVDWDEYRDIPKINMDQPIPKFNRNNI